jgi:hypothetical protein
VVHPEWLLEAERTRTWPSEDQFPCSYDPKRALPTAAVTRQSAGPRSPHLGQPRSTHPGQQHQHLRDIRAQSPAASLVAREAAPRRSPRKHKDPSNSSSASPAPPPRRTPSPVLGASTSTSLSSTAAAHAPSGAVEEAGPSTGAAASAKPSSVPMPNHEKEMLQIAIDRLMSRDKSNKPASRKGRFASASSQLSTRTSSNSDTAEDGSGSADRKRRAASGGGGGGGGGSAGARDDVGLLASQMEGREDPDDDLDFDPEDDSSSQMAVTYRDSRRERGKTALKQLLNKQNSATTHLHPLMSPHTHISGPSSAGPHSCGPGGAYLAVSSLLLL